MSSGLLDFFTLEASEYVEHLDGLVSKAVGGQPDLEGFIRNARALRGSATMAKVGGIADVATALERVFRALQSGAITWNDAVRGAAIAAIDDVKILIRGVRTWSDRETTRAAARVSELTSFAPVSTTASAAPNASAFLATEAAGIARQLSEFADNPVGPAAFAEVLQRVRGLRGIAVLKDLPPLPEIVDALDHAAKAFEMGGAVTPALRALFSAAAGVLADGSIALMRGDRPATTSPALLAFAAAAASLGGGSATVDDVVPISSLFPDDGQPGLVSAAPNPPTTVAERFRMDVVSHAEHLRRLVADATRAVDTATRERLGRELGAASHALSRLAASFGERPLATFFAEQREQAALLGRLALEALDKACDVLVAPTGATTGDVVRALGTSTVAMDVVDIASLAPANQPSLVSGAPATSGDDLHALLERGIAGLSGLDDAPLAEPLAFVDDVTVPIEDLVYRGRDALERAIELRDVMRNAGGTPDPSMLAELFDLLELAATTD